MDLQKLKWLAIAAPLAFLGAVDFARHELFPETMKTPAAYLVVGVVLAAGVYLFAEYVFGLVERMHLQVTRQNRMLAGLYEVARALGQPIPLDLAMIRGLEQVLLMTGADRAELFVLRGTPAALVLHTRIGANRAPGGPGAVFDPSVGIPGWPLACWWRTAPMTPAVTPKRWP